MRTPIELGQKAFEIEPTTASEIVAFNEAFDPKTQFEVSYREKAGRCTQQRTVSVIAYSESAADSFAWSGRFEMVVAGAEEKRFNIHVSEIERLAVVATARDAEELSTDQDVQAGEVLIRRRVATSSIVPTTLSHLLESDSASTRRTALEILLEVALERPPDCESLLPLVASIVTHGSSPIQRRGLACLAAIAQECFITEDIASVVVDLFRDVETTVQRETIDCLMHISERDPSSVIDAVPKLASSLADEGGTEIDTQRRIVYILSQIAKGYPEEIKPVTPTLAATLDIDDSNYRINALTALGRVTAAYPEISTTIVPNLCPMLGDSSGRVRGNAVGLLGDIARQFPSEIEPYVPEVIGLLDDGNVITRSNAAVRLARVAEVFPSSVAPATSELIELLGDADPVARKNACWALGYCDAWHAVNHLKALRNDPNEEVRKTAQWALRRLS